MGSLEILKGQNPYSLVKWNPFRLRLQIVHRHVIDFIWTIIRTPSTFQQILFNINKAICLRLEGIENTLNMLTSRTKEMEEKVDQLMAISKQAASAVQGGPIKKG